MTTQVRQELMQLVGQNPAFLQQVRAQVGELAADPDIQAEDLPQIVSALEATLRDPATYPQMIARFQDEGFIDPGDLPSEFDPEVVVALLIAFYLLEDQLRAPAAGAQGFARGGLAVAAEKLRRAGRDGDTILAHINPAEARMLKAAGGSGTINPVTGLPEFRFKLKKFIKILAPIALNFIAPGLGTAIGTAIGLSGTAAAVAGGALIGGTVSKLSGGSFTQGALGGALGGGLGGAVGSAANEALGAGLGATGQQVLGGALTGAAQGALSGGNPLQGALSGGISALGGQIGGLGGAALQGASGSIAGGGDLLRGITTGLAGYGGSQLGGELGSSLGLEGAYQGALTGALGGAARAGAAGGDVGSALARGALRGSGLGSKLGGSLADLISPAPPSPPSIQALNDKYGGNVGALPELGDALSLAPAGAYSQGSAARGPYAPIPGTFRVAPNEQVDIWARGMGEPGSMQNLSTRLPVSPTMTAGGATGYLQRFINTAETGGYLNPDWATYRPGVQLMASGNPAHLPGESGAQAYVPNFRTPNTADTVMLVNRAPYSPQSAADLISHELYHVKQPGDRDIYAGSPGGLRQFESALGQVVPHLQKTYGYKGAYDTATAVPLNERLADLQSFQFNRGVDFAKDPVFQQRVLSDPYARAAWNASTIERTTRLDARDLPPGRVTSADFGPGGAPISFRLQEALRGRGFAQGGLARFKRGSRYG